MKRALTLGISALALAATTFTAAAADLGARPIGKAPVIAPPVFTWTGFYVGVGLGARWEENDWVTTCLAPVALGTATCPNDVFAGTSRILNANPVTLEPDVGFRVSGYAGFNWQYQSIVLGIEGDFAWADNSTAIVGIPGTWSNTFGPGVDSAGVSNKWDASIRGRAGFLVAPQALLYVTGGAAWLDQEVAAACAGTFPVGWCATAQANTGSDTLFGWTIGGGVEWMLTQNWLLRAEYRYSQYEETSYTFFSAPNPGDSFTFSIDAKTHTAYAGLAYKF